MRVSQVLYPNGFIHIEYKNIQGDLHENREIYKKLNDGLEEREKEDERKHISKIISQINNHA